MTNFKIDGGFDFYASLNAEDDDMEEDNVCLLSGQPLNNTQVKLPCGHLFNYIPLYKEIVQQKRSFVATEIVRLGYNEIKCPYCRTIFPKVLPFIELEGVNVIRGVTSKSDSALNLFPCCQVIRSGVNKGKKCGKRCMIVNSECHKCNRHLKIKTSAKVSDEINVCQAILKSGPRKGKICGAKIISNEKDILYCKRHLKNKTE